MPQTEARKTASALAIPKSTLGVGIIGVSPVWGWATTAHIPALRALPNYEIRALSARSAESARAVGQALGVNAVYSDHQQLVLQPDIDVSAVSDVRRPLISIEGTGEQIVKTAADQIAVIGTLTSGATASIHIREAVAGGTGFLWEINGTDGTLRITADAALPEIFPLTVAGAQGRNLLAELAIPAALRQKWPTLASLEGTPAFNVARAYAAFAADIDTRTHTAPDFADAVRRHEVIAAVERSAASGNRVKA